MAESLRKRIRDNLLEALATTVASIEVARDEPGELHDEPSRVQGVPPDSTPGYDAYPAPAAYPRAWLHSVDDTPVPDGPFGFSTRRAGFVLETWVAETAACKLADNVEAVLADVIRGVERDPERGGLALLTSVGAVVFFLLVRQQRLGGFEVRIEVTYRYRLASPSG